MHQSPLDTMKLSQILDPQDAATSAKTSTSVNMAGWDGVVFILSAGGITGTLDMKVQDSADDSSYADVSGAAITQVAATGDSKIYAIDFGRPTKQYAKVVVTPTGGTTNLLGATALQYRRSGLTPITQDTTIGQLVKKMMN